MTGKLPFLECPNDGAVVMALLRGEIPHRPTSAIIKDHIWDIWVSCWNLNPALRPSMAEIVRYVVTSKRETTTYKVCHSKSIVLLTPSLNACDMEGRSILSLLAGKELLRCFKLIWNTKKTSAAIPHAWDRLAPALAIRWLLEVKSIDPNIRDKGDENALIHAAKAGFPEAISMLWDRSECDLEMKRQSLPASGSCVGGVRGS